MRFIIKEQAYEKLLAAGQYRYEMDGHPTGAMESWRMTAVAQGYQFLRVDLDAREAESGHTYLYHALLDENGRYQRLKYRFWGQVADAPLEVQGDVVLDSTILTAYRTVNGRTYEQLLDVPAGYAFWFPASMGLYALPQGVGQWTAVGIDTNLGVETAVFGLFTTTMHASRTPGGAVRYRWGGQQRTLWRDEQGFVTKMQREDGLTAVASHTIHYQG